MDAFDESYCQSLAAELPKDWKAREQLTQYERPWIVVLQSNRERVHVSEEPQMFIMGAHVTQGEAAKQCQALHKYWMEKHGFAFDLQIVYSSWQIGQVLCNSEEHHQSSSGPDNYHHKAQLRLVKQFMEQHARNLAGMDERRLFDREAHERHNAGENTEQKDMEVSLARMLKMKQMDPWLAKSQMLHQGRDLAKAASSGDNDDLKEAFDSLRRKLEEEEEARIKLQQQLQKAKSKKRERRRHLKSDKKLRSFVNEQQVELQEEDVMVPKHLLPMVPFVQECALIGTVVDRGEREEHAGEVLYFVMGVFPDEQTAITWGENVLAKRMKENLRARVVSLNRKLNFYVMHNPQVEGEVERSFANPELQKLKDKTTGADVLKATSFAKNQTHQHKPTA
jgi:hypothetical protein